MTNEITNQAGYRTQSEFNRTMEEGRKVALREQRSLLCCGPKREVKFVGFYPDGPSGDDGDEMTERLVVRVCLRNGERGVREVLIAPPGELTSGWVIGRRTAQ